MKRKNIVPRRWGNSLHFDYRHRIPVDLVSRFCGRRQFQISLKDVNSREIVVICHSLNILVEELFSDIRSGMKNLSIDEIKEILRVEVRKSILHSHHVDLGTNKYDSMKKIESMEKISSRENEIRKSVITDLKEVEKPVDDKLIKILTRLNINVEIHSINYKTLRRSFIDLYLIRNEWTKELINQTGRTDDDFKRELDEKLQMNLFPELSEKLTPIIENFVPEPNEPYRIDKPLSSLQSTPISKVIEKYFEDKVSGDIRGKSEREMKHSLGLLIEGLGDIPIGSIDIEKCSNLKTQIKKLPRNRKKFPKFKDKSFHELIQMNIKESERISVVTFNKHIQYI